MNSRKIIIVEKVLSSEFPTHTLSTKSALMLPALHLHARVMIEISANLERNQFNAIELGQTSQVSFYNKKMIIICASGLI